MLVNNNFYLTIKRLDRGSALKWVKANKYKVFRETLTVFMGSKIIVPPVCLVNWRLKNIPVGIYNHATYS